MESNDFVYNLGKEIQQLAHQVSFLADRVAYLESKLDEKPPTGR
jgi:hypothetical protein